MKFKLEYYRGYKIIIERISGTNLRYKSKYVYKIFKNNKLVESDIGFSRKQNVLNQAKKDIDKYVR